MFPFTLGAAPLAVDELEADVLVEAEVDVPVAEAELSPDEDAVLPEGEEDAAVLPVAEGPAEVEADGWAVADVAESEAVTLALAPPERRSNPAVIVTRNTSSVRSLTRSLAVTGPLVSSSL